ncbi:MAG: aldo/keto reductase [Polaromonas sp.]|nr:aldo/keto reductase [Polaromonas sp.]
MSLPRSQLILESLKRESDECGLSIQNIAINWLLENPLVTTVLLGPSNNKQLVELLER